MKTISKTKDRHVTISEENGMFIIRESAKYTPYGYTKRKTMTDAVGLTIEELRKILAEAEKNPIP